jgi:hypothetical protein
MVEHGADRLIRAYDPLRDRRSLSAADRPCEHAERSAARIGPCRETSEIAHAERHAELLARHPLDLMRLVEDQGTRLDQERGA